MEGSNQEVKKGEEHIPATQAVVLNDRNMKAGGLPLGVVRGWASIHDRDEPACLRELQGGRARLWVQTILRRRGPLGGGGAGGGW